MDHAWARRVRDQCVAAGVPFFFKQSAAYRTEIGTRLIEPDGSGTTWQQYPDAVTLPPSCGADAAGGRCVPAALGPPQLPLRLVRKG
jgi:Protein of unknown function (DUF5131)